MFSNKTFLINSLNTINPIKNKSLIKTQLRQYSSKKHNTNFDYNLDWIINSYLTNNRTLTNIFLVLNTGFFAYCWLRPSESGRFQAQDNLSVSAHNINRKDYINVFASAFVDRKVDDFIFHTALLFTIGKKLEKMHGTPFIFKLSLFSFYIGILTHCFWINYKPSRNERYLLKDPRDKEHPEYADNKYKYGSNHSISMAMAYFFLYRYYKLLILPVFVADMYYWGPMESSAFLTGIAAGIIL